MTNNPYNNAKSCTDSNRSDKNPTSASQDDLQRGESPAKIMHEHAGEIDEAEYDAMLQQAFEEREQNQAQQKKTMRIGMVATFLAICSGAGGWYIFSPDNQTKTHNLWGETVAITKDVKESTSISRIMEDYDAAMEKIAVRQEQVLDAAEAMGADRNDNDAASQARLERDMKKITGDARTIAQRDAALREKFGKFAEEKRKEIEEERIYTSTEEEE